MAREKHALRKDLTKLSPSAVLPIAIAGFRFIGIDVQPLIGLLSSSLGPLLSVAIVQYDKQSLQELKTNEEWVKKRDPILEGILDMYEQDRLPARVKKAKFIKMWDQATRE